MMSTTSYKLRLTIHTGLALAFALLISGCTEEAATAPPSDPAMTKPPAGMMEAHNSSSAQSAEGQTAKPAADAPKTDAPAADAPAADAPKADAPAADAPAAEAPKAP